MRFPWQKRKVEQPTDFPLKLNTDNLNWCRDARLLLIEGNGTLKWERVEETRTGVNNMR